MQNPNAVQAPVPGGKARRPLQQDIACQQQINSGKARRRY